MIVFIRLQEEKRTCRFLHVYAMQHIRYANVATIFRAPFSREASQHTSL